MLSALGSRLCARACSRFVLLFLFSRMVLRCAQGRESRTHGQGVSRSPGSREARAYQPRCRQDAGKCGGGCDISRRRETWTLTDDADMEWPGIIWLRLTSGAKPRTVGREEALKRRPDVTVLHSEKPERRATKQLAKWGVTCYTPKALHQPISPCTPQHKHSRAKKRGVNESARAARPPFVHQPSILVKR